MQLRHRLTLATAALVLASGMVGPAFAGQFLSIPGAEDYVFSSTGSCTSARAAGTSTGTTRRPAAS